MWLNPKQAYVQHFDAVVEARLIKLIEMDTKPVSIELFGCATGSYL